MAAAVPKCCCSTGVSRAGYIEQMAMVRDNPKRPIGALVPGRTPQGPRDGFALVTRESAYLPRTELAAACTLG